MLLRRGRRTRVYAVILAFGLRVGDGDDDERGRDGKQLSFFMRLSYCLLML
jgi:hypothetical protein